MGADYATLTVGAHGRGPDAAAAALPRGGQGQRRDGGRDGRGAGGSARAARSPSAEGAVCQFSWRRDGAASRPSVRRSSRSPGRWVGAKVGLFASAPGAVARGPRGLRLVPGGVMRRRGSCCRRRSRPPAARHPGAPRHRPHRPSARTTSSPRTGARAFRTIQAALDAIPEGNASNRIVLVRNGTYREKMYVTRSHVSIVGEDRERTRIVFAELRKNWRASHPDDWGAAVVNVGPRGHRPHDREPDRAQRLRRRPRPPVRDPLVRQRDAHRARCPRTSTRTAATPSACGTACPASPTTRTARSRAGSTTSARADGRT